MTVKEIVKKHLKDNGFDGLHGAWGFCCCSVDDLMVACNREICDSCQPGYRGPDVMSGKAFAIYPSKQLAEMAKAKAADLDLPPHRPEDQTGGVLRAGAVAVPSWRKPGMGHRQNFLSRRAFCQHGRRAGHHKRTQRERAKIIMTSKARLQTGQKVWVLVGDPLLTRPRRRRGDTPFVPVRVSAPKVILEITTEVVCRLGRGASTDVSYKLQPWPYNKNQQPQGYRIYSADELFVTAEEAIAEATLRTP